MILVLYNNTDISVFYSWMTFLFYPLDVAKYLYTRTQKQWQKWKSHKNDIFVKTLKKHYFGAINSNSTTPPLKFIGGMQINNALFENIKCF